MSHRPINLMKRDSFKKMSNKTVKSNFMILQVHDERRLIFEVEATIEAAVGRKRCCHTSLLAARLLDHIFQLLRLVRGPMPLQSIPARELLIASVVVANELLETIVNLVDVLYQLVIVRTGKPHLALIAFEIFALIVKRNSMALQNLLCTETTIADVASPDLLLLLDLLIGLRPEVLLKRNLLGYEGELRRAGDVLVRWFLENFVDDKVELVTLGWHIDWLHLDVHRDARMLDVKEC